MHFLVSGKSILILKVIFYFPKKLFVFTLSRAVIKQINGFFFLIKKKFIPVFYFGFFKIFKILDLNKATQELFRQFLETNMFLIVTLSPLDNIQLCLKRLLDLTVALFETNPSIVRV